MLTQEQLIENLKNRKPIHQDSHFILTTRNAPGQVLLMDPLNNMDLQYTRAMANEVQDSEDYAEFYTQTFWELDTYEISQVLGAIMGKVLYELSTTSGDDSYYDDNPALMEELYDFLMGLKEHFTMIYRNSNGNKHQMPYFFLETINLHITTFNMLLQYQDKEEGGNGFWNGSLPEIDPIQI